MSAFWESCLQRFAAELPAQQFNTWIKPLRLEGESTACEQGLQLLAPNGFILKWVREKFLQEIERQAEAFFAAPINISLHIATGSTAKQSANANKINAIQQENTAPRQLEDSTKNSSINSAAPEIQGKQNFVKFNKKTNNHEKSRLFSNFTFDNLVVGRANDLARAAAVQVSSNPGGAYNPLFIYGGAGLGKTHLIHAIGNQILAERPDALVRYVHAEDYYSDVVRAYQQKSFDSFKRNYRATDVLLLDDVQFFNGKNRSQEEFFFLFNALIEARKQIIITCDTYPKDINGLDDRLVTRFDWGLTVQIEPPELEMRVAILQKKAAVDSILLGDDVAFFIAKHLRSNVRELEGALKKVLAYASFHGRPISLDLAKEALKDLINSVRNIGIDYIQKTVADYYKIKVGEIFSKKRTRAIARPRQIAMWLTREVTSHSFPEIGDAFGGRDHTTVIHAVKTIDSLRNKDNELNHDLHVLLQVLKG
ncbi:chromosomal replication initiator protein DnaA [Azonexus sp.]|uniref:chromosomal replication initiator protein DnaA n=1 Tax=Azonexus sp. TaxID=1872668 RepID=UPI0039E50226